MFSFRFFYSSVYCFACEAVVMIHNGASVNDLIVLFDVCCIQTSCEYYASVHSSHSSLCVCVYAAIVWLNSCSNNRPENVCFNANRANNASLASQSKIRMIKSMWKMFVFFLCEHLLFCEHPNTDPEKETHSFITSVDKRVMCRFEIDFIIHKLCWIDSELLRHSHSLYLSCTV